jgi:tRNA (cytidine56-2'-O)-methyltransferase
MRVVVLRLGHRNVRDSRTTTHLFLAARAFGAEYAIYTGQRERGVEEKILKVSENWGGVFRIDYSPEWRRVIEEFKDKDVEIIHLTMYGLPIQQVIEEIRLSPRDKMVIVGGAKVPNEVYRLSDWNVAVTNQPHSEVSALSIFLHELFSGKELYKNFEGARLKIIPQARGKRVLRDSSISRKEQRNI